jgi:NADPH-dependent curcumin reductase CurA
MTDPIGREIQLVSRPQGLPTAANFALVETNLGLFDGKNIGKMVVKLE